MRIFHLILFLWMLIIFTGGGLISQEVEMDTTLRFPRKEPPDKQLPQIQMEEYTIVGLAKITLPHKMRARIFKDVDIQWVDNRNVWNKELPAITFRFSRVKPSLFRLYEFPWFNSSVHYGSFNTAGIDLNSQFKIKNLLPYFSAGFTQSDGHTENAQWSSMALQTGFHQKVSQGHLLHLGTAYQSIKRGIWRDAALLGKDWETRSTLWRWFGGLEQQWSQTVNSEITGGYSLDDFENAFTYSDRSWDVLANINIHYRNTRLKGEAQIQGSRVSVDDGNLNLSYLNSDEMRDYRAALFSARFGVQQNWKIFTAKAGILYQQSVEKITRADISDTTRSLVYPQLSLSAGFEGWGNASIAFQPAAELRHLRSLVRDLPFSDFSRMHIIDNPSRLEAGFTLNALQGVAFHVAGSISSAKNYPAPVLGGKEVIFPKTGGDSIRTNYPGWRYAVIRQAGIAELTAKLQWDLSSTLSLSGWLNVRKSEIKEAGALAPATTGKEIPYIPDLAAEGRAAWKFFNQHQIMVGFEYTGSQFDDLQNQQLLGPFFLLNAGLKIRLSENFRLHLSGKNLLDTDYQEWYQFPGPGVNGSVALNLVL